MRSSAWDIVCGVSGGIPGSRSKAAPEPRVDDADPSSTARLDDPDRVEELVERYGDRVYRLALRITGVEEDAAEAVEHALQTARTLRSSMDETELGSRIYRTVARAAYHRRERRQHVEKSVLDDVVPPLDVDDRHFAPMSDWSTRIDEPMLQGELHGILMDAIDALPADYRTALILHDVESASKVDIAQVLGVDVPAVASLVHRARLFVRKRLFEYFESARRILAIPGQ